MTIFSWPQRFNNSQIKISVYTLFHVIMPSLHWLSKTLQTAASNKPNEKLFLTTLVYNLADLLAPSANMTQQSLG